MGTTNDDNGVDVVVFVLIDCGTNADVNDDDDNTINDNTDNQMLIAAADDGNDRE